MYFYKTASDCGFKQRFLKKDLIEHGLGTIFRGGLTLIIALVNIYGRKAHEWLRVIQNKLQCPHVYLK